MNTIDAGAEGSVIKTSKSNTVYFFKRKGDGEIWAAGEREAWDLMYTSTNWRRKDIVFIGSSDGTTYDRIVKENKSKIAGLQMEIETIREDLAVIEDKNSDEFFKLKRQLRSKNKEISDISKDYIKEAFNAELEKAKGNMVLPEKANILTSAQDREKILKEMGGMV